MGSRAVTVTLYTCDRCKYETEDALVGGVCYEGRYTSLIRAYSGDVGGATVYFWLCGKCSTEFSAFMKGESCLDTKSCG